VAALVTLHGCVANPLAAAKTIDQKAYALYGTFMAFEEVGATIVQAPAVPEVVKAAIRKADRIAKPVADSLLSALKQYVVIQQQLAVGATTNDKLAIATANLEKWVRDAEPLIQDLVKAVGGK